MCDDDWRHLMNECAPWLILVTFKVLIPGKRIYIDDGLISIVATDIGTNFVVGVVENAGFLGSKKGCNLPGIDTGLPEISDQDVVDIKFAVEQGIKNWNICLLPPIHLIF